MDGGLFEMICVVMFSVFLMNGVCLVKSVKRVVFVE